MEGRIRVLFLIPRAVLASLLVGLAPGCAWFGSAEEPVARDGPVIDPQLERREIRTARIDTEDFEVGVFGGALAVQDFGTRPLVGGRLGYHVTEDFFAEALFAQAEVEEASFGGGTPLPDSDRTFRYADFLVGWNILPGEVFLGRRRALDSSLYLVSGAGVTEFAGENHFTASLGAGYRVLILDWFSAHLMVRDRIFPSDLPGEDEVTHNLEITLGLGVFF